MAVNPSEASVALVELVTEIVIANRFINTLSFLRWKPDGTLILLDEIDSGGEHAREGEQGGGDWETKTPTGGGAERGDGVHGVPSG